MLFGRLVFVRPVFHPETKKKRHYLDFFFIFGKNKQTAFLSINLFPNYQNYWMSFLVGAFRTLLGWMWHNLEKEIQKKTFAESREFFLFCFFFLFFFLFLSKRDRQGQ